MSNNQYHCEYCLLVFTKKSNLDRHLKVRPETCFASEKLKQQLLQEQEKAKQELQKQVQELKTKIALDQQSSSTKARKKINENSDAKNKDVPNFYSIINDAQFTHEYLLKHASNSYAGLCTIFQKYYFTNYKPYQYCIKLYDVAREQYGIFDGNKWIRVSLSYILDVYLGQIQKHIYNVLIRKKINLLEQVDKQYTPYFVAIFDEPEDRNHHTKKTEEIYDTYASASYLNSVLTYQEDVHFMKKIHDYIKIGINKYLSPITLITSESETESDSE